MPGPAPLGDDPSPAYRLHVVPWLRGPGGRLLLHGWLAITIGRHIWAWRDLDQAELAHELCHVQQWRRYGARFIARYVRASWRAWRAGGDPYRDNAFEAAARRATAGVPAADAAAKAVESGAGVSSTRAEQRRRP